KRTPEFPELVEAAYRRRKLLRTLAGERTRRGISQTRIAARMRTSQSAIARLEAGEIDARVSTIDRFAAALGKRVEWRVVSRSKARSAAKRR
ncbi:MAG: helix-turn-helix domain-containing protein, partial [Chloroflexi bacterium]